MSSDPTTPLAGSPAVPDEGRSALPPLEEGRADLRVLIGFLGRSLRPDHWRVYLTARLDEYFELAADDVVLTRPLEGSALGGTIVWVRREANLRRTRSASREAQADFLEGAVIAGALDGTRGGETLSAPWLQAACLTGGQLDTLCAACTAVPTAFLRAPGPRAPAPRSGEERVWEKG